jgi:hypothetical protein
MDGALEAIYSNTRMVTLIGDVGNQMDPLLVTRFHPATDSFFRHRCRHHGGTIR